MWKFALGKLSASLSLDVLILSTSITLSLLTLRVKGSASLCPTFLSSVPNHLTPFTKTGLHTPFRKAAQANSDKQAKEVLTASFRQLCSCGTDKGENNESQHLHSSFLFNKQNVLVCLRTWRWRTYPSALHGRAFIVDHATSRPGHMTRVHRRGAGAARLHITWTNAFPCLESHQPNVEYWIQDRHCAWTPP